ncbi:MAG: hypothetical protein H0W83_11005 [Planctomycetes bacterium]|nr:hypothetical protein [Planctomycetota bacterium]
MHPRPSTAPADTPSGVITPAIARYADQLQELAGGNLRALMLYGSGIVPGSGRPLVDNVLVLAADDLDLLRRIARHGPAFRKAGIAAPLVMTIGAIASSRDSFPLELMDIAQTRLPVFGEDAFGNLTFDREHVRLQCERELRTLAIALRQRVLHAGGGDAHLRIADLADGVVRILRGMLFLRGNAPVRSATEVMSAFSAAGGQPLEAVRRAWSRSVDWDGYRAFYAEITALGALVDAG